MMHSDFESIIFPKQTRNLLSLGSYTRPPRIFFYVVLLLLIVTLQKIHLIMDLYHLDGENSEPVISTELIILMIQIKLILPFQDFNL